MAKLSRGDRILPRKDFCESAMSSQLSDLYIESLVVVEVVDDEEGDGAGVVVGDGENYPYCSGNRMIIYPSCWFEKI